MRNKIDHALPPEALFLNPWKDAGIEALVVPEFAWRPVKGGKIAGFGLSEYPAIQRKINDHLNMTRKHKTFSSVFEHSSLPVVVAKAEFRKSQVLSDGKVLLNGAAGTRAINQHRASAGDAEESADPALESYFSQCRAVNENAALREYTGRLDPDLHFAVACRNTFNYFHFITEALAQLTVLDDLGFPGNVYFHYPNSDDKNRPFAANFVAALFPEFEGRVFFERVPKDYDQVITGFDYLGSCEQAPTQLFEGLMQHAPRDVVQKGGMTSLRTKPVVAMNGVPSAMRALRERALKAIKGQDFSYLPKRFYVGRTVDHSRPRTMAGEDLLFEHLQLFGFEYVMFETLTPLEQIAIMAQAEVFVSCHGAGFTNMLFANPDAYVIELGTLQTAQYRWGDFWPLAHASGCTYVNFFCDFKSQNPTLEPVFSEDGLLPVAMSDNAVAHVMAFIVALLRHYPTLKSRQMISDLCRQLVSVDAAEQAVALMDAHPGIAQGHQDLCLILADAYKQLDDPKSELLALDQAYKANRQRWQTLVRIIWCANRCERPQVIRWALSRLKIDFPDRHDAFVGNHDWVKYVA